MSDAYRIVTPENIELDYQIAGMGTRFMALGIDVALQTIFLTGIIWALDYLGLKDLGSTVRHFTVSLAGSMLVFLLFAVLIGYFIILETVMNGQTIGKRVLNIRVRKEKGFALAFWDVLLRNIIRLADFLPFFYATGFIVMFCSGKAKRLGDYAAGTIVVKEIYRRKIDTFLNQAAQAGISEERRGYEPKFPWTIQVIPYFSQRHYFLAKSLIARKMDLVPLAYLKLCFQMVKKVLLESPLPDPQEYLKNINAPAVLEEMTALYEKNRLI
ncbi:MAG: RDD family protein [Bacillota bacterium]